MLFVRKEKKKEMCLWSYICCSEMHPDCAVASSSAADSAQTLQIHLENF